MNCPHCNQKLEIEDRFCGQCGHLRPRLHPPFARLEGKFTQLRAAFRQGNLHRDHYLTQLKSLTLRDQTGRFWALGADSGEWYRFEEDSWVQDIPPLAE